jgi:predicted nucleic acid-binding protein
VVVLDSSFLIAFHNSRDVHHAAAVRLMGRLLDGEWGAALLPEYVFLEVVTVLRLRTDLPTAVSVGETLIRAREVDFVPCSEVFLETFDTFRREAGADLSFADATIVALARRHPPGFVATFDNDFKDVAGVTMVA